jgi:anti-sigma factor RsiW
MTRCFDEAILQSYVDGELSPDMAGVIGLHLMACAQCRATVCEIEGEMKLLAAAFEMGTPVAVPSDALRARIEARIAETMQAYTVADETANVQTENQTTARKRSRLAILGASLSSLFNSFGFAPQFVAAVLALAFVGAISFVAWRLSQQNLTSPPNANSPAVARNTTLVETLHSASDNGAPLVESANQNGGLENKTAANVNPPIQQFSQRNGARMAQTRGGRDGEVRIVSARYAKPEAEAVESNLIPGEQNYLRVITALRSAIKAHGEDALSPQARIEYERNLAVVDRAILETRAAAKANPKDTSVRDFMYAAYQSKVELLSSVAEQTQSASIAVR